MAKAKPFIVGIGGTTRPSSSSERALRGFLAMLEEAGAETAAFTGQALNLPMYEPEAAAQSSQASAMVEAIRKCDALVIASPGYHGSISGMIKNALDYIEDLRDDARPYLHERVVGCIGCAYGWQAANSTLSALRAVTHALRGWPTPMGAAINSTGKLIDETGKWVDIDAERQLKLMSAQMMSFLSRAPNA
ncbi:MAG: NADPH-dependent FMN reductase [Hyphomonadaceae bacterium]